MSDTAACDGCDGTGLNDRKLPRTRCSACGGAGAYPCESLGGMAMCQCPAGNARRCPHCKGTGRIDVSEPKPKPKQGELL